MAGELPYLTSQVRFAQISLVAGKCRHIRRVSCRSVDFFWFCVCIQLVDEDLLRVADLPLSVKPRHRLEGTRPVFLMKGKKDVGATPVAGCCI